MAKKKYYAVKEGRKTGIFHTWEETQKQVIGYKAAIYKSFLSLDEAKQYLESEDVQIKNTLGNTKSINEKVEEAKKNLKQNEAIAFVDGSYAEVDGVPKYSYGAVIITSQDEITLSEVFDDPESVKLRNVSGEVKGATKVIEWCVDNKFTKLFLYYDYIGIEKWATREWKRNNAITQAYSDYFAKVLDKLDVEFIHTPAHTGIVYNELADKLAKKVLGII